MNHRVNNLFALATGVVSMSARSATTPAELATAIRERLSALALAQDLTLPDLSADDTKAEQTTTLLALLQTILAPFGDADRERICVRGCDAPIGGRVLTNFALLLHKFATNAAKYGSLSVADGRLDIELAKEGGDLVLNWAESGGPELATPDLTEEFGSRPERATIEGQLQGSIARRWQTNGLIITLSVPLERLNPG